MSHFDSKGNVPYDVFTFAKFQCIMLVLIIGGLGRIFLWRVFMNY